MAKVFAAAILLFVVSAVWLHTSNLFPRAATTPPINVMDYGATGNGTTDDTAAINSAIAALQPGDTLSFPCGTYLTTSQLTLQTSGVTVDGGGCATIRNTASGIVMVIGASGNTIPNIGPAIPLSAIANELDPGFATVSALGVVAGDYVALQEAGKDSSTGSGDTACDVSGCRGEILKVASVSGNTVTVTTALHDTYDPSVNAATARKILTPLAGIFVKNITFDGSGSNTYGLAVSGVAESAVSGVVSRNVQISAILTYGNFNVAWSNITVTGAGGGSWGGAAVLFGYQGELFVNGMSISKVNADGSGFGIAASAHSTITNLTVDAAGANGRPFKTTSARWNTFNSVTVKNGVRVNNGISVEYYSSHNTFNSCVVTNNGVGSGTGTGNAGITSFGNFNQYNTFNNCTVAGNGNVQVLISDFDSLRLAQDSYVTINGGTFTGTDTGEPVIYVHGANAYVNSANINGPGSMGLYLGSTNACVNNNTFGPDTALGQAILSSSGTNVGAGNILGGLSNLTQGTCTAP